MYNDVMQIYDEYDDEPEDIFLPVDETRYSLLYDMEMDGFRDDLPFYLRHLPAAGQVLEIACGTGRVGKAVAVAGREVTGIDISLAMLQTARRRENCRNRYVAMDMRRLAFSTSFDAVIIPYNSLNLLTDRQDIHACLSGCRQLLRADGILLLQLFVPGQQCLQQAGQRTFQFQIFDDPQIGRVIKEVRRTYLPATETLQLEERYRLRPNRQDRKNEDLNRQMEICAWPAERWFDLLTRTGFAVDRCYGGYDLSPFLAGRDSCLLLAASCLPPSR
jgi:SAM-dependent methyltransferase